MVRGSGAHKATSTMQNLKVTLIVTFETNAIRITSSTQAHMHHCITYLQIDGKVLLESIKKVQNMEKLLRFLLV